MPMTLPIAAARVARSFQSAEQTFDISLEALASLTCELAVARRETDVEAGAGQTALVRLAKAQTLLIAAQNEVLRSHAILKDFARERGDVPDSCPSKFLTSSRAAA